ncbi:hypothetical protein Ct61P_09545 [Colletotrichum tofieldiae]|nr:hypothetical protein Ct61P_09545 [Colletotrichum tofieldiae]
MVREKAAGAVDSAHRARSNRLVYGDRTGVAVMRRPRRVAFAATAVDLFLFASLHFVGFLGETTTILSLALVSVSLVSGFTAHHPEIDRPLSFGSQRQARMGGMRREREGLWWELAP